MKPFILQHRSTSLLTFSASTKHSCYICMHESLTKCFQKFLKILRRLHSPLSWEICDFLLHSAAGTSTDYYFAQQQKPLITTLSSVRVWVSDPLRAPGWGAVSSASISASADWMKTRQDLMMIQPIRRRGAGRDFPSGSDWSLHFCQHGERFRYELENAIPVRALM